MNLFTNQIKDQIFSISKFSKKFRIAKSKSTVKSTLESLGGTVNTTGGKCLIGRETERFYTAFCYDDYVFEGELEDRSYQNDFTYFKDFDIKLYDMIRELLATTNISITYIRLGVPVSEEEFEKLEKKLKKPIPKAVKEFYSLFGEIRILWTHRTPYTDTGRSASLKAWNMDYRDNHIGSFQILPLKTVLFEKWEAEEYCFGVGSDLKIFDTSSEYHMVALDITDGDNPLVYRGEDHGIDFKEASPMLFTDYLHLCLGLSGMRDRMEYFRLLINATNKSPEEVKEAIAGTAKVDINNDAYLIPKINELRQEIDPLYAKGEFEAASDKVMDLHSLDEQLFIEYRLDRDRLEQNEEGFASRMKYGVKDRRFDWQAYEEKHTGDPIFESKLYLKEKKKF